MPDVKTPIAQRGFEISLGMTDLRYVQRPGRVISDIDFYLYSIDVNNVAQNATVNVLAQMQSESDFVLAYMAYTQTANSAVPGIPGISPGGLLQITDTGNGKTLFNDPANLNMVAGLYGFPYILPAPRVFMPNSNIQIGITNNVVSFPGTRSYTIALIGTRIYYE